MHWWWLIINQRLKAAAKEKKSFYNVIQTHSHTHSWVKEKSSKQTKCEFRFQHFRLKEIRNKSGKTAHTHISLATTNNELLEIGLMEFKLRSLNCALCSLLFFRIFRSVFPFHFSKNKKRNAKFIYPSIFTI